MADRNGLIYAAALRRPWVVYSVCVFVAMVPLAMWQQRYEDVQDRKGRDTVSVVVTEVREEGNEDLASARILDKLISFKYPGSISVGDRVDLYRSDSQWHAVDLAPPWVPIAATALLWVPVGVVVWRYAVSARRPGWTRRS